MNALNPWGTQPCYRWLGSVNVVSDALGAIPPSSYPNGGWTQIASNIAWERRPELQLVLHFGWELNRD